MRIEIIKDGVTDNSSVLDVGTVMEIDDGNAASLINNGYAVAIPAEPELTTEQKAKNLDDTYKADTLKEAATTAGVAFDATATKAVVVAAVIEAGKYADLMQ